METKTVYIVHYLYNGWTEHAVLGVYSEYNKALGAALKELELQEIKVEECQAFSSGIIKEFTHQEQEFSIWITEHNID